MGISDVFIWASRFILRDLQIIMATPMIKAKRTKEPPTTAPTKMGKGRPRIFSLLSAATLVSAVAVVVVVELVVVDVVDAGFEARAVVVVETVALDIVPVKPSTWAQQGLAAVGLALQNVNAASEAENPQFVSSTDPGTNATQSPADEADDLDDRLVIS
jgi:hypothetical protein